VIGHQALGEGKVREREWKRRRRQKERGRDGRRKSDMPIASDVVAPHFYSYNIRSQ